MLKGCLKSLALLFSFIAIYYFLLRGLITPPGDRWGALGLGFGLWIVSGLLWNTLTALSHRRALKRASASLAGFEDGATVAVAGTIRPLGEPLLAPFSRRPCVAYEYKMRSRGSSRGAEGAPTVSGEALAPAVIEGPTGSARLLAWPSLQSYVEAHFDSDDQRANARAYVAATQFEQATLSSAFSKLKELLADDDGNIKVDMNNGGAIDADAMHLTEKIVPAGANVCAIGKWSTLKGGIVPDPDSAQGVELIPGTLDAVLSKLAKKASGFLIGGLVVAAIVHGIGWLVLTQFEKEQRPARVTEFHSRVIDDNREGVRAMLRGARHYVNERDYLGRTALTLARSTEVAEMLLGIGAEVNMRDDEGKSPLMFAAERGDAAMLKLLLDRGARIDEQANDGTTALMLAAVQESPEALRFLVVRRANLELRDEAGRSALDRAVDLPGSREILVAAGAIDQAAD